MTLHDEQARELVHNTGRIATALEGIQESLGRMSDPYEHNPRLDEILTALRDIAGNISRA